MTEARTAASEPRKSASGPLGRTDEVRCEIGILLVHGIGQQSPTQTLIEWGEPILDWLSRWMAMIAGRWLDLGVRQGAIREWFCATALERGEISQEECNRGKKAGAG
jgi:hypothetical protein